MAWSSRSQGLGNHTIVHLWMCGLRCSLSKSNSKWCVTRPFRYLLSFVYYISWPTQQGMWPVTSNTTQDPTCNRRCSSLLSLCSVCLWNGWHSTQKDDIPFQISLNLEQGFRHPVSRRLFHCADCSPASFYPPFSSFLGWWLFTQSPTMMLFF